MLQAQLVGPPAPPDYAPPEMIGRLEEPKAPGLVNKDLLLSQLADFLSTEVALKKGGYESNPLPGMGSPAGRAAWGVGEHLLAALLGKKVPIVQSTVLPAVHGTLAGQNMGIDQPKDIDDRLRLWLKGDGR